MGRSGVVEAWPLQSGRIPFLVEAARPVDLVVLWRLLFSFFAQGYPRRRGRFLAPLVVETGSGWCTTRGCLEGFWPLLGVCFFLGGVVWCGM